MLAPDPSWLGVLVCGGLRWVRRVLSSLSVGSQVVKVRNFPGWRQAFPLEEVERFEWRHRDLRDVGVLLLTSGNVTPDMMSRVAASGRYVATGFAMWWVWARSWSSWLPAATAAGVHRRGDAAL